MTLMEAQEGIVREMAALGDWMDAYAYLLEQGRRLKPMEERFKTDANAVGGCQSRVWLHADCSGGTIRFQADSDTQLTRGLLALLLRVLDNRHPKEVAEAELHFIQETDLGNHLSPSRSNGLAAVLRQMQRRAAACAEAAEPAA